MLLEIKKGTEFILALVVQLCMVALLQVYDLCQLANLVVG